MSCQNNKTVFAHQKQFPCPLCREVIYIIGTTDKGKKIGSCGCAWKFKKSRSAKEIDRNYVKTPDGGLELIRKVK